MTKSTLMLVNVGFPLGEMLVNLTFSDYLAQSGARACAARRRDM